jgi:hypothetical protein
MATGSIPAASTTNSFYTSMLRATILGAGAFSAKTPGKWQLLAAEAWLPIGWVLA